MRECRFLLLHGRSISFNSSWGPSIHTPDFPSIDTFKCHVAVLLLHSSTSRRFPLTAPILFCLYHFWLGLVSRLKLGRRSG